MSNRLPPMGPTVKLSVSLGKLELVNPMIAASGTFGWGLEFERIAGFSNADLGAIVLKGTTLKARTGNRTPRIVETAGGAGILNSIGLENPGVKAVIKNYLPKLEGVKPKVIANIAGSEVGLADPLGCADCHGESATAIDWTALGYEGDPAATASPMEVSVTIPGQKPAEVEREPAF